MTTKEFIESVYEDTERELESRWRIQRDRDGNEFIYTPMPKKDYMLEGFDLCLEDPWEEVENEWTDDDELLITEYKNKISEIYDRTIDVRKAFLKKMGHDENYM